MSPSVERRHTIGDPPAPNALPLAFPRRMMLHTLREPFVPDSGERRAPAVTGGSA